MLSWLQGLVDERGRMGDFVLTGSARFDLIAGTTQSLAGRVGRIELLPLAADELAGVGKLPFTQFVAHSTYAPGRRGHAMLGRDGCADGST